MGSDWNWQLRLDTTTHTLAEQVRLALTVAGTYGMGLTPPDGAIQVFDFDEQDYRSMPDEAAAVAAISYGLTNGVLFTAEGVGLYLNAIADDTGPGAQLTWSLTGSMGHRRPTPEADPFRRLHAQLTALWVEVADAVGAEYGRVTDDWSVEELGDSGPVSEDDIQPGRLPSWLGWWTYLDADRTRRLPPLPVPEVAESVRATPSGAAVIALLDDPAAIDLARYRRLHAEWWTVLGNG
jgi:hypothetical protein